MKFLISSLILLLASCAQLLETAEQKSGLNPIRQIADDRDTCAQVVNQIIQRNHYPPYQEERDFYSYTLNLPFCESDNLEKIITELPTGSTWIDMQAGEGSALVEGIMKNKNIKGVSVSTKKMSPVDPNAIVNDDILPFANPRYMLIEGSDVRQLYIDKKFDHWMGKTSLITDALGPISYTDDMPKILQIYLDLLMPQGQLLFNMNTMRNAIQTPDQQTVELLSWLKTIPGIKISDVTLTATGTRDKMEDLMVFKIVKVDNNVKVPMNLKLKKYGEFYPPTRSYEIEK